MRWAINARLPFILLPVLFLMNYWSGSRALEHTAVIGLVGVVKQTFLPDEKQRSSTERQMDWKLGTELFFIWLYVFFESQGTVSWPNTKNQKCWGRLFCKWWLNKMSDCFTKTTNIIGLKGDSWRCSGLFPPFSDISQIPRLRCLHRWHKSSIRSFFTTVRTQGPLSERRTQKPHAHTGRRTCTPSRHPFELPLGWIIRGLMWLTMTSVSVFVQILPSKPHGAWEVEKLRLAESSQSCLFFPRFFQRFLTQKNKPSFSIETIQRDF